MLALAVRMDHLEEEVYQVQLDQSDPLVRMVTKETQDHLEKRV